ncbi:MAG: 16S rRNA (cytidine(1402)-2'-O)-methyltransferase [Defluviitaleaceae bacterium]|nr:16S rRNA (cytidine(1402)-2'-O)-methyltransferase [Defluviitaleaceae bacterium]
MPGKLYVVATPIGNLSDMTPRGVQVLSEVDMIAAEDTRHSRVLLNHFKISTPSFSCHKFNEEKRGDFFISALLDGKNIALISDAGTPCISDPGHKLVSMAAEAGAEVIAVCGANAAAAALSVSGFDASNFTFLGFLPRSKKEQNEIFQAMPNTPLVFYESPLRITKTLTWLAEGFQDADICLCNDLTKRYERIYRGNPTDILEEIENNPSAQKGEYTCVVHLNAKPQEAAEDEQSLEAQLINIIVKQNCTLKDAANILHQSQKKNKKAIYAATLRLKELLI